MLEFLDNTLQTDIKNQHRLVKALNAIAAEIKSEGGEPSKLVRSFRNLNCRFFWKKNILRFVRD